jgi:hypothetical protein
MFDGLTTLELNARQSAPCRILSAALVESSLPINGTSRTLTPPLVTHEMGRYCR